MDEADGKAKGGSRLRRLLFVAFLAAVAALTFVSWSWVSAQARAVVVLSTVLETPTLSPLVRELTDGPRVEDAPVAGVPTLIAEPRGAGPHPALVFMNGAVPPGRHEPTVGRLARGLARAGYLVYVPDVPGLRNGEISGETVSATVDVTRAAADESGGGRAGLVGVSMGASIALLAAQDPRLEGRVSVISCVAPYADLETVLRIATTDRYRNDGELARYETPDYLRLVTARSLVALLPPGTDRASLLRLIPEIEHYYPPRNVSPDPLMALPAFLVVREGELSPQARSVVELLANRDPERFDELYSELPAGVHEAVERLSPITGARELGMPVEIASAPRDKYFPVSESRSLARETPDTRLTVTRALDHAEPEPSLDDVPAFLRLNGFVVRSLREAGLEGGAQQGPGDSPSDAGSKAGRERRTGARRNPAGPVPGRPRRWRACL